MLYEKLEIDIVNAMKNHNKERLSTLRMLKTAILNQKINKKLDDITDDLLIECASKQVKTHKDSIVEFEKANRKDLIDNLEKEIKILEEFLPEALSEEEINKEIDKVFDKVKPEGKKDMGKVMKELSSLKGKADFKLISEIVNKKLN